jgi:hypothetical protein
MVNSVATPNPVDIVMGPTWAVVGITLLTTGRLASHGRLPDRAGFFSKPTPATFSAVPPEIGRRRVSLFVTQADQAVGIARMGPKRQGIMVSISLFSIFRRLLS